MKIMEPKPMRHLTGSVMAVAVGTSIAAMIQGLAPSALGPTLLAAIAAALAVFASQLANRGNGNGATHFIKQMGKEVNHIMIGVAKTSYFVDSIKKKVDHEYLPRECRALGVRIGKRNPTTGQGEKSLMNTQE